MIRTRVTALLACAIWVSFVTQHLFMHVAFRETYSKAEVFLGIAAALTFKALITAVAGAALVVAVVGVLTWENIQTWFQSRRHLVEQDKARVGFLLQEKIANGQFEYVHGVWDTGKNKLIEGRRVQAKALGPEVRKLHARQPLRVLAPDQESYV